MKRHLFLFFVVCFVSKIVFSQNQNIVETAIFFYENKKYSAAQSILSELHEDQTTEQTMYLSARCSKELKLQDALKLYNDLNEKFPYNLYNDQVNQDIADIYYREKDYPRAITYLEKLNHFSIENTFRLAYSHFNIDSLEKAKYYFSKVKNLESKFSKPAKYYYAYISYETKLYNSALQNFLILENDKKFGKIVPYYISQIYFHKEDYQNLIAYAKPLLDDIIPQRREEIFRLLGEAYYRTGDYKNAITFFQKLQTESNSTDPMLSFMLGYSYYNTGQYEYAILNLENVSNVSDSILQFSYYYLGASYIKFEYYTYALNAFKKSITYEHNQSLKEEAWFNYAKLSYQLDLPFDNTFNVFQTYLKSFVNSKNTAYIESLMIKMFESTNMHFDVYEKLIDLDTLTLEQQKSLQRASFYLAIKEYNNQEFRKAILYFNRSIKYPVNETYTFLSKFWLSDCLYNVSNFSDAIDSYTSLPTILSTDLSSFQILKKYNLAYAYYKSKDYQNSVKWYRSFLKVSNDSLKINDALLRLADSYFMLKKYDLAFRYYQKSLANNLFDVDYALYQSSISARLLNDDNMQLNCLVEIFEKYKNSTYFLLAVKDLASYHKNTSNFENAKVYYNILIDSSSNVDWLADAYLNIGNMYMQADSIDQAINQFLIVVNDYSNTKYFKQSLSSLQFAYSSLNRIDDYIYLVESLPEYNITISEQDSLLYNSAYMKYVQKDYFLAKSSFKKYLNRFENGIFHKKALYYVAVSSNNIKDTLDAIYYYKKLMLCEPSENHKKEALVFLARYYYQKDDYRMSNSFYEQLQKIIFSSSLNREVISRLMIGYENIDVSKSSLFAEQVINLEKVDDFLISKAYLIIARDEFNSGNYAKSKSTFSKLMSYQIDDHCCEAMYHLSYFAYLDDSLKLAEELIFNLVKNYLNKYYTAKSFILLADIYIDINKTFQAKATLESVIENYNGTDLTDLAIAKLESIIEKEKNEVFEQKKDQAFIEIFEDDYDYEVQRIDENYIVKEITSDTINENIDKINLNNIENEFD